MDRLIRIAIGIQARSTSERLPNKVMADICGKPMLQWVLEAVRDSCEYLAHFGLRNQVELYPALLIPVNDPLKHVFANKIRILEGSHLDVLSRYKSLSDCYDADYIVRITGDCPMLPPPVISKAVIVAVKNAFDYVSNVDERLRVSFDGMDVEVISKRALDYLDKNAISPSDREHVTTFIRKNDLSELFSTAHIVGYADLLRLKLSVDTEDDLELVREQKAKIIEALALAEHLHGIGSVHRF